jgi:hypothetical protein
LQAVTALRLLPDDIENRVNEFGAFSVMTFGPVVSSSGLSKHKVIGPEDLAIRSRPHTVHGPGLQIHEHSTGYIPPTTGFIVVDIDTLQLQIGDSLISSSRVDSVLLAHHLPELGTDLIPALPSLDMQNLTHLDRREQTRNSPATAATEAPRNGRNARETERKKRREDRRERPAEYTRTRRGTETNISDRRIVTGSLMVRRLVRFGKSRDMVDLVCGSERSSLGLVPNLR